MSTQGYIFKFQDQAFSPNGKVGDMSQAEIDGHNRALAQAEARAIKEQGRGILYLAKQSDGSYIVSDWLGKELVLRASNVRKSRNNFGAERIDVDFTLDGSRWHGVNIGDNQILRVRRCKK